MTSPRNARAQLGRLGDEARNEQGHRQSITDLQLTMFGDAVPASDMPAEKKRRAAEARAKRKAEKEVPKKRLRHRLLYGDDNEWVRLEAER